MVQPDLDDINIRLILVVLGYQVFVPYCNKRKYDGTSADRDENDQKDV